MKYVKKCWNSCVLLTLVLSRKYGPNRNRLSPGKPPHNNFPANIDLVQASNLRCLFFNSIEFDGIKIGVVQLLPDTEKFYGVPVSHPVLDDVVAKLRRQVTTQLKPVLRERDFEEFNLDRSFEAVREMAGLIADKAL